MQHSFIYFFKQNEFALNYDINQIKFLLTNHNHLLSSNMNKKNDKIKKKM